MNLPSLGFDISEHNGNVDFNALKAQGVEWIAIRSSWGHFAEDAQFRNNVAKAEAVGMPYMLYHYSYVSNQSEKEQEAQSFINLAKTCKPFALAIDMEDADGWKAKVGVANNNALHTEVCRYTCELAEQNGFFALVYASASWFTSNKLDKTILAPYGKWVAQWWTDGNGNQRGANIKANEVPTATPATHIWQFTSMYIVGGKRFDANYMYLDIPAIKGQGVTPVEPVKPTPAPTPKPTPSTSLKVGQKIKIKNGATDLNTGSKYADFVYSTDYVVIQIDGSRVVFGPNANSVTGATNISNIVGQSGGSSSTGSSIGSTVRIKNGAKDLNTGSTFASWVYNDTFDVIQKDANRVVFGKGSAVTGVVSPSNCY